LQTFLFLWFLVQTVTSLQAEVKVKSCLFHRSFYPVIFSNAAKKIYPRRIILLLRVQNGLKRKKIKVVRHIVR